MGLLRLAMHGEQALLFEKANRAPTQSRQLKQKWVSRAEAEYLAGRDTIGHKFQGALYSDAAITVDTPAYLRALWSVCAETGRARWESRQVKSLAEIDRNYEVLVIAAGAGSLLIQGLDHLPLKPCRGQSLEVRNDGGLKTPLIAGKYAVPVGPSEPDGTRPRLLIGASFEYDGENCHRPPDVQAAEECLRSPLSDMHPPIAEAPVERVRAGVRALPRRTHNGYVPLVDLLPSDKLSSTHTQDDLPQTWIFTGLGSRGLTHHAFLGRRLARAILSGDVSAVPSEARRGLV